MFEKNTITEPINIIKAGLADIEQTAMLFDSYRQFYQQDADFNLAKTYISERIKTESSVIFIA